MVPVVLRGCRRVGKARLVGAIFGASTWEGVDSCADGQFGDGEVWGLYRRGI